MPERFGKAAEVGGDFVVGVVSLYLDLGGQLAEGLHGAHVGLDEALARGAAEKMEAEQDNEDNGKDGGYGGEFVSAHGCDPEETEWDTGDAAESELRSPPK